MKNIIHKLTLSGVIVTTLAIALAGFVYAAIPDAEGVIHGCYRSSGLLANGDLRIIDSDTQICNNNETKITWNQTGPQGPPGHGSVVSERLFVPYGTVGQSFISMPGFGDITLNCAANPDGLKWIYSNNSGETVHIYLQDVVVPDGGTFSASGGSPATLLFSYGDGNDSNTAKLTIARTGGSPTGCTFVAFAEVN